MSATEQEREDNDEAMMMRRGNVVWHSSDEDGGGPDVGTSVGFGSFCLFAGEVPGLQGGWSLVVYPESGDRIDVAETVYREEAREMIEAISLAIRFPTWHRIDDPANPPPMDGTWLLLTRLSWNGDCEIAGWHFGAWRTDALPNGNEVAPEYWMHRPAPPAPAEGGEG